MKGKKSPTVSNKVDEEKAIKGASMFLESLGIDLTDENYKDTPKRMFKVYRDFTEAIRPEHKKELKQHFDIIFPKHNSTRIEYKGMLVQSPIRVFGFCSHHFLPVVYNISFAYIPRDGKHIGFSKIVRILRLMAKRPMNQEDFTQEVSELFMKRLNPKGLGLMVSGVHFCMMMRGVECDARNTTSVVKGEIKENVTTRDEFLRIINTNHFEI